MFYDTGERHENLFVRPHFIERPIARSLMAPEKSIIDSLKKKEWTPASSQKHALGNLEGKSLDSHKLLPLIGPKNRFGASYFQVFLQNESGEVSQQPVLIGLHNKGRYPSYNWIEILRLSSRVNFGSGEEVIDISLNGLIRQLFQYLADLLPLGGHMMVEYDSPEQQDTADSLALGIPPVVTPLGYMLFLIGCGAGFKDWHFAEGGSEGPRKLQGYKALNSRHALLKAEKTAQELIAFLDRLPLVASSELERAAQDRALAILDKFKRQNKIWRPWRDSNPRPAA